MAVEYFTDAEYGGLYRVDLRAVPDVAQALSPAGWVDVPNVARKMFTGDNLSFVPVDAERAGELAVLLAGSADVLAVAP